ncbi:hypothetical protein BALOs_0729 [Halobacteriovorax sp. BALOs_7]|uniref:hypothetical protein n=1 Tax=Halobacteriovorax sp. BALOs_7 TaxID=2109558 RepID=UPI000EA0EBB4|nr:hypothetical protein [Halobacteriovorax sp. BALOs_7]AYF43739.1 hypothetical protein BALOs_0729 [Halobacteriovorax sp. BALOs_7]
MSNLITLENFKELLEYLNFITAIFASGIVIYLFITKKEQFASLYNVLKNYTQQVALSDLRAKLHSLERFKIDEDNKIKANRNEIINLMSEISGQLKGNPLLKIKCADLIRQLDSHISNPNSLTEPQKRVIGHELFEIIRHLSLNTVNGLDRTEVDRNG